jgi:hypothetical protein
MKRWAALTVALYAVGLLVMTIPLGQFILLGWSTEAHPWYGYQPSVTNNPGDVLEIFHLPGYWIILGFLAVCQALLLFVPVQIEAGRPLSRRKLWLPVVLTAFFMGLLTLGLLNVLLCGFGGDKGMELFVLAGNWGYSSPERNPVFSAFTQATGVPVTVEFTAMSCVGFTLLLCWLGWGFLFHRHARNGPADGLVGRLLAWVLRGSILEFLIAVPCHVVVRERNDCCAPAGTMMGLATGLALMLISFGPGVFFLFTARARRLRPRPVVEP